MRTVDFSPLFRSAIGFDRLFDLAEAACLEPVAEARPLALAADQADEGQVALLALAGEAGCQDVEVLGVAEAHDQHLGPGAHVGHAGLHGAGVLGLHMMRDRWDDSRPFLPWLHAIVRYKIGDAMRKRSREARHRCDLTLDELSDVIAAPDQGDRHMPDMDRALASLSSGQRDVVSSLAIEGQSVRETAERLKTSEGAVRVTLHRALQRLTAFADPASGYARKGKS